MCHEDRSDIIGNDCIIYYSGHGCKGTGDWAVDGYFTYNKISL